MSGASAVANPYTVALRSAGQEIVACGTALTAGDDLELSILDLSFVFEFKTDDGKAPRIEAGPDDGKRARVRLFNFDNVLGAGPTTPMEIGTLLGRKLRIAFVVQRLAKDSPVRSFHYSLFRGD